MKIPQWKLQVIRTSIVINLSRTGVLLLYTLSEYNNKSFSRDSA